MAASTKKETGRNTRGRERGRVCQRSSFPNGDTPVRATNDVNASSRDQVNSRAQSTIQPSVTSTRGSKPCTINGKAPLCCLWFLSVVLRHRRVGRGGCGSAGGCLLGRGRPRRPSAVVCWWQTVTKWGTLSSGRKVDGGGRLGRFRPGLFP